MQNKKQNYIMTKAVKKTDLRDITAEYTLPDYLPDINRMLRVSAQASHPEKYFGSDAVEYDGKIIFDILYATSEGEIRNASFDTDYAGSVAVQGIEDISCINAEASAENANCRLAGPRKLTAKCRLAANIYVSASEPCDPAIGGKSSPDAENDLQYRKKALEFANEIKAEEKDTPVSEDIELDPGMPEISRIVRVDLYPCAIDTHCSVGKIGYTGAFIADILYEASGEGESKYISLVREVPISGTVDADGAAEDSAVICHTEASAVTFRPQTNELGETRTVELDFDYSVYMRVFRKDICEITTDLYSLSCESSAEKATFKYLSPECAKTFNFSFSESAEFEEDDGSTVLCTSACASVTSVEKSGSKAVVCGNVSFFVIVGTQGTFTGKSFMLPFKAETEMGRFREMFTYIAKAYVSGASARITGDKICFDAEITVSLVLFGENEAEALRSATLCADRPVSHASKNGIVLYYPTRTDDLWSIAKKYSTTTERLALANGGKKDVVCGEVMIIPR